jgi:hypothetical protein
MRNITWFILLASLLMQGGCRETPPSEEKVIAYTRKALASQVHYLENPQSYPMLAGRNFSDRQYILDRTKAALAFLDGRKKLERPYTISAELDAPERLNSEGLELWLDWLEYQTHAQGVVLYYRGAAYDLPVFAQDDWNEQDKRLFASTAYRCRTIRVVPGTVDKPLMRHAQAHEPNNSPGVIVLPEDAWRIGLRLSVYDANRDESNFVEVFYLRD